MKMNRKPSSIPQAGAHPLSFRSCLFPWLLLCSVIGLHCGVEPMAEELEDLSGDKLAAHGALTGQESEEALRWDRDSAALLAPDKSITTDTELCGNNVFGKFTVAGGARVFCSSGDLTIEASTILVDPASSINLSASSAALSGSSLDARSCGGSCSCISTYVGGAGGGNSAAGGRPSPTIGSRAHTWTARDGCYSCVRDECPGRPGGEARASAYDMMTPIGQNGGAGCTGWTNSGPFESRCYDTSGEIPGGKGGGSIRLIAKTSITIQGQILADGSAGASSGASGAGGGSGGSVLLAAPSVKITGTVSAQGGKGGSGNPSVGYGGSASGGDGADGWIKILRGDTYSNTGTLRGAARVESFLPPLVLRSTTHPNPALAYNDKFSTLEVSWDPPYGNAAGYYYTLSDQPSVRLLPTTGTFTAQPKVTLPRAAFSSTGQWYLHVVTLDRTSATTGTVSKAFPILINQAAPAVTSSSHPDQSAWYPVSPVLLQLAEPAGVPAGSFRAYQYFIDRRSTATAGVGTWTRSTTGGVILTADSAGAALAQGTYYVHVLAEDTQGVMQSQIGHFRIQLGTEPPRLNFFGYVLDEADVEVKDATVRFEPYGRSLTTDVNGYFLVKNVYQGNYELTVSATGYKTRTIKVLVDPSTAPLTITLRR